MILLLLESVCWLIIRNKDTLVIMLEVGMIINLKIVQTRRKKVLYWATQGISRRWTSHHQAWRKRNDGGSVTVSRLVIFDSRVKGTSSLACNVNCEAGVILEVINSTFSPKRDILLRKDISPSVQKWWYIMLPLMFLVTANDKKLAWQIPYEPCRPPSPTTGKVDKIVDRTSY